MSDDQLAHRTHERHEIVAEKGEFIIGQWTDESTADDRQLVALAYHVTPKGAGFIVIDAKQREGDGDELVSKALTRDEVIGTPLAEEVFAFGDAVYLNDHRLAELRQWPKDMIQ